MSESAKLYASAPHGARMAHAALWLCRAELAPSLADLLGVSADEALSVLSSLRDAGLAHAARELADEHPVAAVAAPVAAAPVARATRPAKGSAAVEATEVAKHRARLRRHARRRHGAYVFRRDGYRCSYCGSSSDLTLDHIVPLSRGGANGPRNLTTACRGCNSAKNARTPGEWLR